MNFEELYISARKKEGRIYTDEEVLRLPGILSSHVHYNEWEIRRKSTGKLINYLQNKNKPLNILEVGCGNGWLSARLSVIPASKITGIDININELDQAKRVFGKIPNLSFINSTIENNSFEDKFDVIVFAASIQYFPEARLIINTALSHLNQQGEIHILDSYFYTMTEIDEAKKRSWQYYQSLGVEKMAECYFHHPAELLSSFNHRVLFDPGSFRNRLSGNKIPFPWICITAT